MPAKPVLMVMARWPSAGRCKRRLASDLGSLPLQHADERAAHLQRQLLVHTMAVANRLRLEGHLELAIAVSGLAPRGARRWGRTFQVDRTVLQRGGSLGCRLRHLLMAFRRSDPGRGLLLIGTDLPGLNHHDLLRAVEFLQQEDLILGPADDGGYWLIGLSEALLQQPARWPIQDIPWGSTTVLESTIHRAQAAGLDPALLASRQDIDRISDLQPWLT